MKILITTDLFQPTINGVVTSVLNLRRELADHGHEVKVLTTSDRTCSYKDGEVYYVKSVPSHLYPDVRVPISRGEDYVEELVMWKPDVIHSQCEFFSYGFAKRIAKETGAVLIHTYHTLYEQYTEYIPVGKRLGRAALAKWMKARLKGVDRIIAPTKKVEEALREYGVETPIDIIPSGIELRQFAQKADVHKLQMLREKYGIPEGTKVLISLGRLGFEKQVGELIQGMKDLASRRKEVVLLIVGDGPARESLQRQVREQELESYVKFTGMVDPQETYLYYQLGDIFVCASTSETQGLTYIEAAASALPLVCRKDPCLNGVLEEGDNGYFYETTEEFAEIVCRVAGEEQWLREAAGRSRSISGKYDTTRFGKSVEQCYRRGRERSKGEDYESITVFKEQANRIKKWCWSCYDHAKRVS